MATGSSPTSTRGRSRSVRSRRVEARPPRAASDAGGFTLIELAIVLLVLGIAISFVVPRLRRGERVNLEAEASRLATSIRWAYEEAALRQLPLRLNLDIDGSAYWVSAYNEDPDAPQFVRDDHPLARPRPLPDDVTIADVVTSLEGTVADGIVFAQFLPEGATDILVVHLRSLSGAFATIAMNPLTGETRSGEGYLALPEDAEAATGNRDGARARFRGSSRSRDAGGAREPMQRGRYSRDQPEREAR